MAARDSNQRLTGKRRKASEGDPEARSPAKAQAAFHGEYDASGVDLSLLRYLLRLSPLERLLVMEEHARDSELLHAYGRRHREAKAACNS